MDPNRLLDGVILSARGILRVASPILIDLWVKAVAVALALFRWVRTILIAALWVSFEGYKRGWRILEPILENILGVPPTRRYRLAFCIAVSLVAGNIVLWMFTPIRITTWTMLLLVTHGLVIHTYWDHGARWCRRLLGVRPSRYDAEKPFDGLDLGN